jgi:hypothetical protein
MDGVDEGEGSKQSKAKHNKVACFTSQLSFRQRWMVTVPFRTIHVQLYPVLSHLGYARCLNRRCAQPTDSRRIDSGTCDQALLLSARQSVVLSIVEKEKLPLLSKVRHFREIRLFSDGRIAGIPYSRRWKVGMEAVSTHCDVVCAASSQPRSPTRVLSFTTSRRFL